MTQHPSAFHGFADVDRRNSYMVEDLVSSSTYPGNTSQYHNLVTSSGGHWNTTTNVHPSVASLPNHLQMTLVPQTYHSGHGSTSDAARGHTAYPTSGYSPATHPRSVNFQNSYNRYLPNSRRRSEHDLFYAIHNHTPFSNSTPSSLPNTVSGSRNGSANWQTSRSLHCSSQSVDSLNWVPSAHDDQYFNVDSHWSTAASPPQSPEMRIYMPSPGYSFPHEAPAHQRSQPNHAANPPRKTSPPSSVSTSPPASRRSSVEQVPQSGKICSHCHATSTPLWRREPNTLKPLCNACGLYLQQRHKHRPQELIDADAAADESESEGDGSGPECSHCHTHRTSVWRRSKTGAQLCNACGVYSRLRGRDRPLSLKRNRIKPRTKHNIPKVE